MSDFITDVEQQYEVYCKIAEDYGFIDFNAKKNGFRCTTKSNEFNAGWIAFTGAIAAMREDQQTEIDQLKSELALCREENKGLVGKVSELKKHSEMLIAAANSWTYSEGEKNILLSQADDLDRILNGEKALRGETTPEPKWKTIKVVCQRCGHYLNGCHCNHFGDQCPHLNTSKFGDDGLAECFNCNKIINKDREVVGDVDDINLTR